MRRATELARGASPVQSVRRRSARRLAWWAAQARAQPLATSGALIVLGWIAVAIFAPLIAPYDPIKGSFVLKDIQAAPSAHHLFGTDDHGRDILSRVMFGSRSVLLLSGVSTLASLHVAAASRLSRATTAASSTKC